MAHGTRDSGRLTLRSCELSSINCVTSRWKFDGIICVTGGKQTHLTLNGKRLLIAQLCDHVHDLLVQTALAPRENRTRIMLSANHHAPLLADGSHLLLAMRERNGCHFRHLGDQRRLDVEVLADGNVVDLRMVHGLRSNVS